MAVAVSAGWVGLQTTHTPIPGGRLCTLEVGNCLASLIRRQTGAGQSILSSPYSEAYRLGAGKGAGFRAEFVHLQKGFPDFCLLLTTFEVATWRFVVRFSPSRSKTRSPCECFGAIVSAPAELMQGAIAERELRDQEAERLRITGWPSSLSILIFKGGEGLAFPLPPPFIEKRRGGHCSRVLG